MTCHCGRNDCPSLEGASAEGGPIVGEASWGRPHSETSMSAPMGAVGPACSQLELPQKVQGM